MRVFTATVVTEPGDSWDYVTKAESLTEATIRILGQHKAVNSAVLRKLEVHVTPNLDIVE